MSYLNNEYEYAKNSIKRKKREMKKEEEVYKNEIKKEISSIENENRQILNKQREEQKNLAEFYNKLEEEKLRDICNDRYQKELNRNLTEIKLKSENELQKEKNNNIIKNNELYLREIDRLKKEIDDLKKTNEILGSQLKEEQRKNEQSLILERK